MKLSIEQLEKISLEKLEILCSLDLTSNQEADEEQTEIAAYLSNIYEYGGKRASRDNLKAFKYKRQAEKKEAPPSSLLQSKPIYTISDWFNWGRLTVLQIGMIADYFKRAFLPTLYGIGGLGYILDFAFDAVDIAVTTIRPAATDEERNLSFWQLRAQRFKNALNEDGRLAHMENALIWGTLNAVTFFLAGAVPGIILSSITAGGLGHDFLVLLLRGGRDYVIRKELLDEKTAELDRKKSELENLKQHKNEFADETHYQKNLASLENEVKKLECYQQQLEKSLTSFKIQRAISIFGNTATLGGIALMLFPPTTLIGIPFVVVGLVFSIGSKMKDVYDFFKPPQRPANTVPAQKQLVANPEEVVQDIPQQPHPANSLVPVLKGMMNASAPEERKSLLNDDELATNHLAPITEFKNQESSGALASLAKALASPELANLPNLEADSGSLSKLPTQSMFAQNVPPSPGASRPQTREEAEINLTHARSASKENLETQDGLQSQSMFKSKGEGVASTSMNSADFNVGKTDDLSSTPRNLKLISAKA